MPSAEAEEGERLAVEAFPILGQFATAAELRACQELTALDVWG